MAENLKSSKKISKSHKKKYYFKTFITMGPFMSLLLNIAKFFIDLLRNLLFILFLPITLPKKLKNLITNYISKKIQIKKLRWSLNDAKTYHEFYSIGEELDQLEESYKWRKEPKSGYYDYKLLGQVVGLFKLYLKNRNSHELINLLRATTTRNLSGIGNSTLYEYAYSGTKNLIHNYSDLVI